MKPRDLKPHAVYRGGKSRMTTVPGVRILTELELNVSARDRCSGAYCDPKSGRAVYRKVILDSDDTVKIAGPAVECTAAAFAYWVVEAMPHLKLVDEPTAPPAEPPVVKRDWVRCPICNEPDMRKETGHASGALIQLGDALIHCVNHACRSNGGTNDPRISAAVEAARTSKEALEKKRDALSMDFSSKASAERGAFLDGIHALSDLIRTLEGR